MDDSQKSSFKVIIVGGSVAGMTLAHSLSRAKIDWLILESGSTLSPQAGASISLAPNGARILDQLGIYDDIEALTEPLLRMVSQTKDGVKFHVSNVFEILHKRLGYPTNFLDRMSLLRVIGEHIKEREKVLLNKRVVKVEHYDKGVAVFTKDGGEYTGDMVVGADGVHSVVRSEMWRYADLVKPGFISTKEKTKMFTKFSCVFGISGPTPGVTDLGSITYNYAERCSSLVAVGKTGQVYWFVFQKMDKKYVYPDCPRFTKADAEKFAYAFKDNMIVEGVPFSEILKTREHCTMTCLEENVFENWNFGRFACIGDSIHKMTPNIGQGGNNAIETAAELANSLHKMINIDKITAPTTEQLSAYLDEFSASRKVRALALTKSGGSVTRTQVLDGWKNKYLSKIFLQNVGDVFIDSTSDLVVGAAKLNHLPLPERSVNGWMSFDQNIGIKKKPNKRHRALKASSFLFLSAAAVLLICGGKYANGTTTLLQEAISSGKWETGNGGTISIRDTYLGIPAVDAFFKRAIISISPSVLGLDRTQKLQMISFVAELVPIQAIWTIEAWRVGNYLTLANLPLPFTIAYQSYGFGVVAPLYYFLNFVRTSWQCYVSYDLRVVPTNYASTITPSVLISIGLPALLMFAPFFDFTTGTLQALSVVLQLFPFVFAVLHRRFAKMVPHNAQKEKLTPGVDIPILRRTYIFVGVLSAAVHLYVRSHSLSGYDVFFAGLGHPFTAVSSAVEGLGQAARWNYLLGFGSSLLWAAMSVNDLKKKSHGGTGTDWVRSLLLMVVGTAVVGPGAVMAAFWMWRENILCARQTRMEMRRVVPKV